MARSKSDTRKFHREDPEPHHVPDVEAIAETPKAILVRLPSGKERWVPKSCVHDDSEVWKEGDDGTLVLAGWFAKKDGWMGEED